MGVGPVDDAVVGVRPVDDVVPVGWDSVGVGNSVVPLGRGYKLTVVDTKSRREFNHSTNIIIIALCTGYFPKPGVCINSGRVGNISGDVHFKY